MKTFLCCFKIETGGIIYGGLVFVLNMLYMFLFLGLICGLCFLDCGDLRQKIDQFQEKTYSSSSRNAEFIDTCNTVKTVATVVFVILIILSAISATIGFCCIKGVETRNHKRLMPLMIVSFIAMILSALPIFSFTLITFVYSLVCVTFYLYMFLVLKSLYSTFKEERNRGFTLAYHTPGVSPQAYMEKI